MAIDLVVGRKLPGFLATAPLFFVWHLHLVMNSKSKHPLRPSPRVHLLIPPLFINSRKVYEPNHNFYNLDFFTHIRTLRSTQVVLCTNILFLFKFLLLLSSIPWYGGTNIFEYLGSYKTFVNIHSYTSICMVISFQICFCM